MIDVAYWLQTYGYVAVLMGTFLEGESILLAGTLAAHAGHLRLGGVAMAALAGSFAGDQFFFWLGRRLGQQWLERRPKLVARTARIFTLAEAYPAAFILSFRFLYGLRSLSPFVLGASRLSAWRFLPLNFLGAVLWVALVCSLGTLLAPVWHAALLSLQSGQGLSVGVALAVPLLLWLWVRLT